VQASPSLQEVPLAFAGLEHRPVAESHDPAVWHWSEAAQTAGFPPMQMPDWHVSVCVQASPSLHEEPLIFAGLEQRPVATLQAPAVWHGSGAAHVTGLAPVHVPAWQVSVCVQALPSLHDVPSVFAWLHAPVAGLQALAVWH
jgi:hypothetical protein